MSDQPAETFKRFIAAINAHDIEALSALMHADHLFIDSLGNRVQGAARMEAGWAGYFKMCADYSIQIDHCLSENGTVLAAGHAGGIIDEVAWTTPAAWGALIRDGLVVEWQVFADNKPVYEILAKRRS